MTLAKVSQRLLIAASITLSLSHARAAAQSVEPTPDPYFKTAANKPDFSETYVPPTFSPGSIGNQLPKTAKKEATPWSHERSIVRDRTDQNDFKSGFQKPEIVDPPSKIRLASATEPVQQDSIRIASRPTITTEPAKQFELSRVVAIVGGEPIFVGDMMFEANQIIEAKIPQAPESVKQAQRNKLLQALTKKFVDQKLIYVDAMGKLPAEANVDEMIKQASNIFNEQVLPNMMESSGVKSLTDFDANLRVQGSSLRQVRIAWAKDQLARQFLQQDLDINPTVSHQEMLQDYQSNKEKYAQRARVRWEQIMVRFDKSKTRKEAKRKIAEIGNDIVYGASFAEKAKKHSHGFRASKGGQHDWTGKGALVLKEIDKAIFELPIGKLSDIIESRDGYHIIRVLERNEASYTPFTEAQVEIRKRIKNEKINAVFEDHIESLRQKIPVEYFEL
jgi:parvulin-like peptidyl-prolyl isomerase